MNHLTIRRPDDFHIHFRRGAILQEVVPFTSRVFARAMVMPNTDPPILNGEDVILYREEILTACKGHGFEPLMTFKITPETTVQDVRSAKGSGAIAGKLYPDGVTTGSEDGVRDFDALDPIFEEMAKQNLVLSVHGEMPAPVYCMDREGRFLDILRDIAQRHQNLRIVLEHISSANGVDTVLDLPTNVAGTITAHHLELTTDDILGDLLRPHNFCKPVAKRPEDRQALRQAAVGGTSKFFLGSDSAPHPQSKKECDGGCAGCFTAPFLLPILAEIFEEENALERFEPFVSQYGAEFYGLPLNTGSITLAKRWGAVQHLTYSVDDPLVPYGNGRTFKWQIDNVALP